MDTAADRTSVDEAVGNEKVSLRPVPGTDHTTAVYWTTHDTTR